MSAVFHGQCSVGERVFSNGFKLRAQSGFLLRKYAESLDGGATDDVRRIVVERHEQAGGAPFLERRVRGARDDESEMGASSPVVVGGFAEEIEQSVSVRGEQRGLFFGYTACGISGALPQRRIIGCEGTQERHDEMRLGKNLRRSGLGIGKPPGVAVEPELAFFMRRHLLGSIDAKPEASGTLTIAA
jgi:hypothetical protein